MSGEAGGWMWLLMNAGLVVLLGAALAYGMLSWRKNNRSPAMDRLRDRKTEELHSRRDPEEAAPLPGTGQHDPGQTAKRKAPDR